MPVILFSSIFILIAYVPNAWGFHWSKDIENLLMTPYNYSMGLILGTNFQVLAFILAALLIVVDVIIYYPFLKVYDEQILAEEAAGTMGLILGTNFQVLAFILAALLIVVDVIIYYPFLKVYDEQILAEEAAGTNSSDSLKEKVAANFDTKKADAILEKSAAKEITDQTNVLVLCAGGGTSGLLANALNKAAKEYGAPVTVAAGSYGAHREILPQYQLVILAPQVVWWCYSCLPS